MKHSFLWIPAILILLLFASSCGDDEESYDTSTHDVSAEPIIFSEGGTQSTLKTRDLKRTVLGEKRENPFTTSRMAEAHNNLYGTSLSEMEATHLYIKFMPQNPEDAATLDDTDEVFYDYPLEYEVIEMGDYWQELTGDELPELYAIFPVGTPIPSVNHELIADLYLDGSNPILIAESFRLSGLQSEIKGYVRDSLTTDEVARIAEDMLYPAPPPPEGFCEPGCWPVYVIVDKDPVTWEWRCECPPPPTPPATVLNECGCPVNRNRKRPGGCVMLEDTQLGMQGLRNVKVIMKDTWFSENETWTDDNGCWNIQNTYDDGLFGGNKAWMWVRFKSDRVTHTGNTQKQVLPILLGSRRLCRQIERKLQ